MEQLYVLLQVPSPQGSIVSSRELVVEEAASSFVLPLRLMSERLGQQEATASSPPPLALYMDSALCMDSLSLLQVLVFSFVLLQILVISLLLR